MCTELESKPRALTSDRLNLTKNRYTLMMIRSRNLKSRSDMFNLSIMINLKSVSIFFVFPERRITAEKINLTVHSHFICDMLKHCVDLGFNLKTKIEIDPSKNARDQVRHFIIHCTRIIHYVNMNKPIMIGSFGLLIKDGCQYFRFNISIPVCFGKVYHVCSRFRHAAVIPQILDNINVLSRRGKNLRTPG